MSRDESIEQAAQVLSTSTTCDGQPYATELHRRQAHALADAGLLAQPMPTREEIADTIYDALEVGGWYSVLGLYPYEVANAVLDLLKGTKE